MESFGVCSFVHFPTRFFRIGPSVISILFVLVFLLATGCERAAEEDRLLTEEAYVWQRTWTEPVLNAVREEAGSWQNLALLATEVRWTESGTEVVRVDLPLSNLARLPGTFSPVLRLGTMSEEASLSKETDNFLSQLSVGILREWRAAGLVPSEFQVDFDAPTSALDEYRARLTSIRRAISPTRLTITALPTWLPDPNFREVARATDGYVLQVHSFRRPNDRDHVPPLCDPSEARRAVKTASRLGVPFRVALPTYSYALLFDEADRFVRIASEGTLPASLTPGRQVVRLSADPVALADLVRNWTASPPPGLSGIIWFRLPTTQDRWNWPIETLRAVRIGRLPESRLEVFSTTDDGGMTRIFIRNTGETEEPAPASVHTGVPPSDFLAGDGWNGFSWGNLQPMTLTRSRSSPPLRPGEIRPIAWLRLTSESLQSPSLDIHYETSP